MKERIIRRALREKDSEEVRNAGRSLRYLRSIVLLLVLIGSGLYSSSIAQMDSLHAIWSNSSLADSIRFKALNECYPLFAMSHPGEMLQASKLHLELADMSNDAEEMVKALNESAISYFILGYPDSSLAAVDQAINIQEERKDTLGLARLYVNLGNLQRAQGNYQDAVRSYNQSLGTYRSMDVKVEAMGVTLHNMGLIYSDVGMHREALEHHYQACELYKELGITANDGIMFLAIGDVLMDMDSLESAERNIRSSIPLLKSDNNQLSLAEAYYILADIGLKRGMSDSVLHFAQKSLEIFESIGNPDWILNSLSLEGKILLNEDQKASDLIRERIEAIIDQGLSPESLGAAYDYLYKYYAADNDAGKALEMLEKYVAYSDTVKQERDHNVVIRETIRSEYERKLFDQELEHEQKRSELELAQTRRLYTISIIGLLSILAIVYYARVVINRQKQHQQELLNELEQLKNKSLMAGTAGQSSFQLNRERLEQFIERKLNETDWSVLNKLLEDPVMSNKDLADQVFLSVDGLGSSLRRMYELFSIKESKYKKISLIMEAIKISNGQQ